MSVRCVVEQAIVADTFNRIPAYGLIHDWLGRETVEQLLRFAQSNEPRFEDTRVTHKEGERVDITHRVSRKLANLGVLDSKLRGALETILPDIFTKLGNKSFIPSKIEVELVAHGDGAFFARHIDTITDTDRVISVVYYFHALPKAFSGGVLRLHSLAASGRQGTFVDIAPDHDTLVFFQSFVPHEVMPVKCAGGQFLDSRFAVNFWIYRG
jgi:SM-20-related protein